MSNLRLKSLFLIGCVLFLPLAGQVITTYAGANNQGPPNGTPALQASIGPNLVTADKQGNIYFIDQDTLVMKINAQGNISRFAGNGIRGYSGDGGPAVNASVNGPSGIFADASGNVFLADTANFRIRKIDGNGQITTIAGNGKSGYAPNGALAVNASIGSSYSVAEDSAGNIYFADAQNNVIGKVDTHGILTTLAGTAGKAGYSGDGGPAASATLNSPLSVTVDPSNNIVIADTTNNVLRVVSTTGVIRTLAGTGKAGYFGDNGPAISANLYQPWTVSADPQGNILFVDYDNDLIRRVGTNGLITTVAGNLKVGLGADNIPATSSPLYYPFSVAAESTGSFLIADFSNNVIRRVTTAGLIVTVAGNGSKVISPNGVAATSAVLASPSKVAMDQNGNLLIADLNNHLVERVNMATGTLSAIAGIGRSAYNGDNVSAVNAALNFPQGLAVDGAGNIYISDAFNFRIRKVSTSGIITTIAGTGQSGYQGDNGPAAAAQINVPQGLRFDSAGDLVFADSNNNVVRMITPQGIIKTIAGTGAAGYNRDGVPATQAMLSDPTDVCFDSGGNLYIADSGNNRIRKVAANGTISTVAGTGVGGFSGDGTATSVELLTPAGINFDGGGNLIIADQNNQRIRLLTPGGLLKTIAGDGVERLQGDGGLAAAASLAVPQGVVVDSAGDIFIADSRNDRIRVILGVPATFNAGGGPLSFTASSGGSVTASQPISLASSVPGLAFTASSNNSWIQISSSTGTMPATISISVDPSQLSAGTLTGQVSIQSPLAATPSVTLQVTAVISPAVPAKLTATTAAVNLNIVRGTGGTSDTDGQFTLQNTGGGTITANVVALSVPWLQTNATSPVTITPGVPVSVTLSTVSSSLSPGTYSTNVTVDGGPAGKVSIPVTLTIVNPQPQILLSQVGLTFTAAVGGGAPASQAVGILNKGQGSMNWTAVVSTLSGGPWLTIDQSSGTVQTPLSDVSTVNVSVNATGLAQGSYYGQIQVLVQGAANSPQSISVLLNVQAAGSHIPPVVTPSGLIFVGTPGSAPGSQNVTLQNLTSNPIAFLSSASGGASAWLQYAPTSATLNPGQPVNVAIQANFANIPAGAQSGAVTFTFSDGSIRTVTVLTVVSSASGSGTANTVRRGGKENPAASGGCGSLSVQPTTLTDPSVGVPVQQPASVQVNVQQCGSPLNTGAVAVTFSNGDPQLNLVPIGSGNWSGTWTPRTGSQAQVKLNIVAIAEQGITVVNGTATLTVAIKSGGGAPLTIGVGNAASGAGVYISPGGLVSVYGSQLADSVGGGGTPPFSTQVNGTVVMMAGTALPLRYVSPGQVNAQVPFGLNFNTQQQLVVQRGATLSVPVDIVVAPAQPGIYTQDSSGTGAGVIVDSNQSYQEVTAQTPAKAGDVIIIYCNGLGAVIPPVPTGSPAPLAGPLSQTVNPVTVTIGGLTATVGFAGLTPGYPDLYQVNATVPAGLTPGTQVPVVLTTAGQLSPPVTMAVQ
jgi:uncharacterized protein (TIGR03437 family)